MGIVWLIANSSSASTDAAAIEKVRAALSHGSELPVRLVDLQQDELPALEEDAPSPEIIATFGGDGTAVAAIDRYGESGSALLVLPGGTMNLLAARLHGDAALPEEIIARSLAKPEAVRIPRIEGPDALCALTGIIVGSTVIWGNVREELREGDIGGVLRAAGDALDATLGSGDVHIMGTGEAHRALFVYPTARGLEIEAILADTLPGLVAHGFAWLRRDFLGGPTEAVATGAQFTLRGPDSTLELLADGERTSAPSPLLLRHGWCPARLLATKPVENAVRCR